MPKGHPEDVHKVPNEVMDREREVKTRDTNVFLVGAVTAE